MSTIYYAAAGHPVARRLVGPLQAFYRAHGDDFRWGEDRDRTVRREHDRVILWNGRGPMWGELEGLADLCVEVGWLPQSETAFANRFGTTGAARWPNPDLRVRDDFSAWRTDYLARAQAKIVTGNLPAPGRDPLPTPPYVLAVGQLERDSSLFDSPIATMRAFLACVRAATDLPIVWRPHPGEPASGKYALEHPGVTCVPASPLYPTIQGAAAVVAISSTVLIEAALCRVPAVCLGFNVWSDLPWPATIWRSAPDGLADDLITAQTRRWRREWRPDALCDFLRRQQVQVAAPVLDPAVWRWWA